MFSGDNFSSMTKFLQGLVRIPRLFVSLKVSRPFLLYIHGFSTPPEKVLEKAAEYNARADRKYNVIPVIWDTTQFPLAYMDDRKNSAPDASELFAQSFGRLMNLFTIFMRFGPTKCLMCHSMGNYVLQGFGQSHRDIFAPFKHIFMVAPDVREDIFDTAINDYQPSMLESIPRYFRAKINRLRNLNHPGTNFDALANPGKDVAAMAHSKVHVLWRPDDTALFFRRLAHKNLRKLNRFRRNVGARLHLFLLGDDDDDDDNNGVEEPPHPPKKGLRKLGGVFKKLFRRLRRRSRIGRRVRRASRAVARTVWGTQRPVISENPPTSALGANGDRQGQIHEGLKDKVLFENCAEYNCRDPLGHNYQWSEKAIEYYESVLK